MPIEAASLIDNNIETRKTPLKKNESNWSLFLLLSLLVSFSLISYNYEYIAKQCFEIIASKNYKTANEYSSEIELQLEEVYIQHLPNIPDSLPMLNSGDAYEIDTIPFLLKRWSSSSDTPSHSNSKSNNSPTFKINLLQRHSIDNEISKNSRKNTFTKLQSSCFLAGDSFSNSSSSVVSKKTSEMLDFYRDHFLSSDVGKRTSYWDQNHTKNVFNPNSNDNDNEIFDVDSPTLDLTTNSPKWQYEIKKGLLLPNVSHKPTILNIARMAANAYTPGKGRKWETVGNPWDHSGFGWNDNGLRGHIFTSKDKKIVVISFKGTSLFSSGGSTGPNDRFNDNRLFSCCCASFDITRNPVCDCLVGEKKCSNSCLKSSLVDEDLYIYGAAKIFLETALRYPSAYIILTGHSLGGAVSSLVGLSFGVPAIAFESPGESLAAKRLGLPIPLPIHEERLPTWHIGHNTDPIYMGTCNTPSSICYLGGYSMDSKCHLGKQCVYDTAKHLGWRRDIRHHRIIDVIYYVLEPWGKQNPKIPMPECKLEKNCKDCNSWTFVK
ncbi:hypothetical protein BB560_001652 [Smittium megazygosporum]|uniref:triacylglycerol lipase n=1 Tax=Smittium megazygosporum TaxID=133381 RepID=A0A2T9ZH15_9FUNG|nr:hypothetical protein BB560_001650 [Smittium megazygosporum]PVV03866.1 hypothetical protein BB560_001652 [Smittium megazygosporum]